MPMGYIISWYQRNMVAVVWETHVSRIEVSHGALGWRRAFYQGRTGTDVGWEVGSWFAREVGMCFSTSRGNSWYLSLFYVSLKLDWHIFL